MHPLFRSPSVKFWIRSRFLHRQKLHRAHAHLIQHFHLAAQRSVRMHSLREPPSYLRPILLFRFFHKISDHLFFLLCPSILSSPKTLFINQTSLNCGRNFRSFPAAGPPLISSRSSEHTGLSCQPFSLWRRAPDSAPGGESCAAGCFLVHPGIISMFSIVKFA